MRMRSARLATPVRTPSISKASVEAMDIETFYAKIDASEKAYQNGDIISQTALEKEITTWKRKK